MVTQEARCIAGVQRNSYLYKELNEVLQSPHGPALVFNYERGPLRLTQLEVEDLIACIPAVLHEGTYLSRIVESGVLRGASESNSVQQIGQLLYEYWIRTKSKTNLPLLIDDNLAGVDHHWREFAWRVIGDIARTGQVVIFTNKRHIRDEPVLLTLERPDDTVASLAFFDYARVARRIPVPRIPGPVYVKGARYPSSENKTCEFKEVKGLDPVQSIKSNVDQYVVAFLNAGVRQQGKIVWGVRDEDRVIVG